MKAFIKLVKRLKWDLETRKGRLNYLLFLFRNWPGHFGKEYRKMICKKAFKHCGDNIVVWPGVSFRNIDKISVGDNVRIGENNIIQAAGGVTIGDNVIIGPDVKIWSANHRFDDVEKDILSQGYEYKEVVIRSNVWIGGNAFIMPGAEIGEGTVISAGAVVGAKKIPPYSILAGNPARKIGERQRKPDA